MAQPQVIVVGGGLAGMSAAHTVVQSGGRVLVLDKSPFCGGNSTKATSGINAAGTRTQRKLNIPDTPELFEKDTTTSAMEGARPDLIHVLTHESAPAVEWLMDSFNLDLTVIARLAAHSEPRTHRGKERFPGMAITYGLMEKLEEIAAAGDRAQIINKATVVELIQDESGAVIGCVFEKKGQKFKEYGPVILATGGFGADFSEDSLLSQVSEEWDTLHAWSTDSRAAKQSGGKKVPSPNLLTLPTTNGVHCSGDGVKLALKAGSGTFDLHCVQVHPTGLVDPAEPEAKVKFLAAEALRGSGGIILDKNGKRFCDELGKRDYVTGRMWLHNNGPYRLCLNGKASDLISWHCEHYRGRGLMKQMTGAELAKAVNVSPDELQKEFDDYNRASKNPGTDKWDKKFFEAVPVEVNDTFHVAEITPVIHYCMGGISGNKEAEVITPNGTPIPGLYGAGEILGGIHGTNRLGGSSLLDCVVYGRVAGRSASRYMMQKLSTGSMGGAAGNINVQISPEKNTVTLSWGGSAPASTGAKVPTDDDEGEVDPNQAFYSQGVDTKKGDDKSGTKAMSLGELAAQGSKEHTLVAVHGNVYDLTEFKHDHPGGAKAIELYAGKDATTEFDMLHKMEVLDKYAREYLVAPLEKGAKL
mmetsp:Transcript_11414/g.16980  ORF Transcript_11414/g.16980 Transcript_11414/m.16980 type:complete len:642 (-) Transcript_11414:31-1956(-)